MISLPLAFLISCGEDSSSDDAAATAPAAATGSNVLTGTVIYEGTGVLSAAVLVSDSPNGYPYAAIVSMNEPAFPLAFELKEIPDGEYFIFAFLDKGAPTTGFPDADDLTAAFGDSKVKFGADITIDPVEITVKEKE